MAKKKEVTATALELEKFESKVRQFQDYLERNDINKEQNLILDSTKRHKEIECQIKIMDALPGWIGALERLREGVKKTSVEMRGDIEPNGLMKDMV